MAPCHDPDVAEWMGLDRDVEAIILAIDEAATVVATMPINSRHAI